MENKFLEILGKGMIGKTADKLIESAILFSPKAKDQAIKNIINALTHLENRVKFLEKSEGKLRTVRDVLRTFKVDLKCSILRQ